MSPSEILLAFGDSPDTVGVTPQGRAGALLFRKRSMSGSAAGRDASGGSRPHNSLENAGDRALFDAVLRETESAFVGLDPDGSAVIADLRQVALAHPNRLFDASVGAEMVRVLLDAQVSRMVAASRMWGHLCNRVAGSLCEDPVARERLERLWNHLQGRNV